MLIWSGGERRRDGAAPLDDAARPVDEHESVIVGRSFASLSPLRLRSFAGC